MKTSALIKAEDLLLLDRSEIVIIDASAGSKARYHEKHLEGAQFADVNTDLANIGDFAKGGRHPLPEATQFAAILQKLGISKDSHVVVYDDKMGGNAAARLWWMLKAIGHEKVQVIDGGFDAAIKAGFPTSSAAETAKTAAPYPVGGWMLPLSDMDEVERVAKTDGYLVIDVRDANRYAGLTEPIDLMAGHIPGAANIPYTENLNADGTFLAPEVLKEKYQKAFAEVPAENVIVHCGSGITACHTLLAMDYAGLPIPKLYVGSWSEWSRNNKDMLPLIVEYTYDTRIEKVWQALTDKEQMKAWYFGLEEFKAEKGFKFQFTGGDETVKYLHECEVLAVNPPNLISYSWTYPEHNNGYSVVSWELAAENENRTRLKLSHSGLESFPRDNPNFAVSSFTGGWNYILGESLKKYLEKV